MVKRIKAAARLGAASALRVLPLPLFLFLPRFLPRLLSRLLFPLLFRVSFIQVTGAHEHTENTHGGCDLAQFRNTTQHERRWLLLLLLQFLRCRD